MKVLVLNCGSSSLKFKLMETSLRQMKIDADVEIAKGLVEKIGLPGAEVHYYDNKGNYHHEVTSILNHREALSKCVSLLQDEKIGVLKSKSEIDAIGHRVVHGGEYFSESVVIDSKVINVIQECARFAPLHNPHNLEGIRVAMEFFPNVPNVAAFDTQFHHTIPPQAYLYAIPTYFYYRDGIRRYGFHGLSHCYITYRFSRLIEKPTEEVKLISCHLGNGSSITAVKNGKSVDTSMGFTPLEGLVMGTRCGDIDPEVVIYIMARENLSISETSSLLNKQSGLLGLSGISNDMRHILEEADKGNLQCKYAFEVFSYRVKKYISAYLGVLNGVDGIVFTAGIGENSYRVREKAISGLENLGVKLDPERNREAIGKEMEISTPDSRVKVWVIPTNEELVIARDTVKVLSKQ